jgi:Fe-S-cluster containining protein
VVVIEIDHQVDTVDKGIEDNMETPISCCRCGLCCINLLVKLEVSDLKIFSDRLGLSNHDLLKKYVKKTPIGYVLQQTGNQCVFLTYENNQKVTNCSIYSFRPEPFRSFIPSLLHLECQEGFCNMRTFISTLPPV